MCENFAGVMILSPIFSVCGCTTALLYWNVTRCMWFFNAEVEFEGFDYCQADVSHDVYLCRGKNWSGDMANVTHATSESCRIYM